MLPTTRPLGSHKQRRIKETQGGDAEYGGIATGLPDLATPPYCSSGKCWFSSRMVGRTLLLFEEREQRVGILHETGCALQHIARRAQELPGTVQACGAVSRVPRGGH